MDDGVFIDLMTHLWGGTDPNPDLWEIALLDDDPEPDAGDVLSGSVWWETGEAEDRQGRHWGPHYRDQHPFPIDPDPDEETF